MDRKYSVWNVKNTEGEYVEYFVTDITQEEFERNQKKLESLDYRNQWRHRGQEFYRPRIATFPISELYPKDEQNRRARMLCDYLNKIQEARDQAERGTILIDAIKGAPQTTP